MKNYEIMKTILNADEIMPIETAVRIIRSDALTQSLASTDVLVESVCHLKLAQFVNETNPLGGLT